MKLEQFTTKRPEEKYYSTEYKRNGNQHAHWYRFYNADFAATRDATVEYTDLLKCLQRIVKADYKGTELDAYDRESLNSEFDLLIKTDYTLKSLEDISKSVVGN